MANWYDEFGYDEKEVSKADSIADRLTSSGPYIGRLTRVWPITFEKGTKAVKVEFQLEGFDGDSGKTTGTLFTENAEGKTLFGAAFLQAAMCIFKVKSLGVTKGKIPSWDNGKQVEIEGERFTHLEGKPIGVLWQRELTDKGNNFSIAGFFDASTRLMASEIRDKVTKAAKLDKAVKNLKDKDSRTNKGGSKPDVFADSDDSPL